MCYSFWFVCLFGGQVWKFWFQQLCEGLYYETWKIHFFKMLGFLQVSFQHKALCECAENWLSAQFCLLLISILPVAEEYIGSHSGFDMLYPVAGGELPSSLRSFLWKEANWEEILPPFSCLCANSGAECLTGTDLQKKKKKIRKHFPHSFLCFTCRLVTKTLSISKVVCFIIWWSEPNPFHLCFQVRHHIYKLPVSVLSALQLSGTPRASPRDFRDEAFLSVGLCPPWESQAVAPGEPRGVEDE